jgi:2-polyprenyl-3-methyl-5-hydroxy-6-metoxy-1,4-benzoquinol methylase
MTSKVSWSRKRAIDVHDETARIFSDEYASDNIYDSPFRYGRHLIDQAWARIVSELPKGAQCLDIGSGIGAYMTRLLEAGFEVQGVLTSVGTAYINASQQFTSQSVGVSLNRVF